MPAEWAPHEATWIVWPHNASDWPGKFAPIPWVYAEIVRRLIEGEKVRILVNSRDHEFKARRILKKAGADSEWIEFFDIPTNRGWTRDFGPIFVKRPSTENSVAAVRFRFNAWAKYPDWRQDDLAPQKIADALGLLPFSAEWRGHGVVLEGGAIDGNGLGDMLVTEECLLDEEIQIRNPGFTRDDYHGVLKNYLGVDNVIWLGKGIAGDDTHGHVDDLCRFVHDDTVVLCQEKNPQDDNYQSLTDNKERLQDVRLAHGGKLNIVDLPMPTPLIFDRQRLPASYANFLIANACVLVPTFNDPHDRLALGILAELFPGRKVIGIHAVDLVWGLGTIHCLTQQQPQ
ncbi:MAG: agmatine deiminase family protein [Candidatus Hinthialibacter sp.]